MAALSMPVGPEDHVLGPADARITLVQYGRYDCPHCLQAVNIVNQIRSHYGEKLRLVYRHYPIEGPHSMSKRAAEAAEAAGEQSKFWEMHSHLLQNQDALDDASLVAYSTMLGLETHRFAEELTSGVYAERVHRQFLSGRESGVESTPTFFINGIRHDDYWDFDTLTAAIEAST